MEINEVILKELVKRGYSISDNDTKIWDVSDSKLWYLTPELSQGFLNLYKYEPFRRNKFDKEVELIKNNVDVIINLNGFPSFNLIDLGCGDGEKAKAFIESMKTDSKIRYCPVDISNYFLEKACGNVKSLKKIVGCKEILSDFNNFDDIVAMLRSGEFEHNIVLLLGETISHYDIHDLLFKLSEGMGLGDVLVIGNGIRTGEKRFVEIEKYKVPLFNDWFIHIVNGLGLENGDVKYEARFADSRLNRLEAYYKILKDKTVIYKGKEINFKSGDEGGVAVQYKYFEKEFKDICSLYFKNVEIVKDKDNEYALMICKK